MIPDSSLEWNRRLPLDSPALTAWHIAKSAYQVRPDVFRLGWLGDATGIDAREIAVRLRRLYEDRLFMLVMNLETRAFGLRSYCWTLQLHPGAPKPHFEDRDIIVTGFQATGACDFFHLSQARVLDNLLWDTVLPLAQDAAIRICPVERVLRDTTPPVPAAALDPADAAILEALGRPRAIADWFDFTVLAAISGLDAAELQRGLTDFVENRRLLTPAIFVNWQKLGVTHHLYAVRLFQTVPLANKAAIAAALEALPGFWAAWQFSDAYYDFALLASENLAGSLAAFADVDRIDESTLVGQSKQWGCRLDEAGWERFRLADDFLQDRVRDHHA